MVYIAKTETATWGNWTEDTWGTDTQIWSVAPEYINTTIKPLDIATKGANLAINFVHSARINGGEDISFNCYEPEDDTSFVIGGIYKCYTDRALTRQLPTTFILQEKNLIKQGIHEQQKFFYQCKGIGVSDLLYRTWLNPKYKSIKFKTLMENLMDLTRRKVSILSTDYSQIEDYDYTFVVFEANNKYLGELIEEIRPLGFCIYLDPNLRLVAKHKSTSPAFDVDFFKNTIDNDLCILSDADIANKYKLAPVTSLVVEGGYSEESDFLNLNVVTNENPTIDLNSDVRFEEQYILQSFDDLNPQGYTKVDSSGIGWDKRYLIYDDPLDVIDSLYGEIKFQLINKLGNTYLIALNDGNAINPENCFNGFLIRDQELKIIANQNEYSTGIDLKAYELKNVLAISGDRKTVTLNDVTNLNVGDYVNITGNFTTANATNVQITAINGMTVTVDTAVTEGAVENVTLSRVEEYVIKWTISVTNETTKFYFKRANSDFEMIDEYSIGYPNLTFLTLFNNYDGSTVNVENGIWEVGNVALDYCFLDKAELLTMYDADNNKLFLCAAEQFATLSDIDAVVNRINKNGLDYAQVEFISPSIVRTISRESTSTRLYMALQEEDFLKVGMNCLVSESQQTCEITNFNKGLESGYIDVSPALNPVPSVQDTVYINTSIPPSGSSYRIQYVPAIQIMIRENASEAALEQFKFREKAIQLPEFDSIADAAQRALDLVNIEVTPSVSGSFGFIMDDGSCEIKDCNLKNFFELPPVGAYITTSDQEQNISNELAELQAISFSQVDGTTNFNIGIDFGIKKEQLLETTQSLLKQFGIFRDPSSSTNTFNIPATFRETVYYNDLSLTVTESQGYDFLSGLYVCNYSGVRD